MYTNSIIKTYVSLDLQVNLLYFMSYLVHINAWVFCNLLIITVTALKKAKQT